MDALGKSLFERCIVQLMQMDDTIWARHANPWSVGTRFTCLPLIVLAIWSREWFGMWFVTLLFPALVWTWLNPRIFPPPESFDNWASKATFGARVWLNRGRIPIPIQHLQIGWIIILLCVPSLFALVYGLYHLAPWATFLGMAWMMTAKAWYCDRMVWLYEEMSTTNAFYASWMQKPGNDNRAKAPTF